MVYQLGLVEREIGEVVRGLFTNTDGSKTVTRKTDEESDSREKLTKKAITEDDVCPICQEDLFEQKQPTTYCRYDKHIFVMRFSHRTLITTYCT